MNKKMKACFESHVIMHSVFGFGLALFLAAFIPGLSNLWLGLGLMVLAFILDAMRKK